MNDLRQRISALELQEKEQSVSLKDSYQHLLSSVNPVNIVRATMKNVIETPGLRSTVLDTVISAGAGVLGKKVFVGRSDNFFRKLGGLATQFFISNFVRNKMPDVKEKVNGQLHE